MAKYRGFSIVLHDVHKGQQAKSDVQDKVQTLSWRQFVIAEEPYVHQDGSHIHLFLQLRSPRTFKSVLGDMVSFWKSGRVQVDVMRGAMTDGCKYVMEGQSKKDSKDFDPLPIIFLDAANANVVGVQAKVVLIEDLKYFFCRECNTLFCSHYDDLECKVIDWPESKCFVKGSEAGNPWSHETCKSEGAMKAGPEGPFTQNGKGPSVARHPGSEATIIFSGESIHQDATCSNS